MELSQLEQFYSVATTANLSKSASDLCITPQALSNTIKQLETELGCNLFDRSPNGLVLNNFGRTFFVSVQKILFTLEKGKQKLLMTSKERKKEISIGVMASSLIIAPCISAFIKERTDIIFDLVDPVSVGNLAIKSSLDFLIGDPNADQGIPSSYESFCLAKPTLSLMVSKTSPYAHQEYVDLAELKDAEWCVAERNISNKRSQTQTLCAQKGFSPNIRLACDSVLYRKAAALYGNLCYITPFSEPDSVNNSLCTIPLSANEEKSLYICWQSEAALSPHAKDFLSFLKQFYTA